MFRKSEIRISGFPDSPEIPKIRISGFPTIWEIRIFRIPEKSGNLDFLDFRRIWNSGFPGIQRNPEILIFRISEKCGNPDFSNVRSLWKSGFPGIPRIPDFRMFWISGKSGFRISGISGNADFPDFRNVRITVTALNLFRMISNAVIHYSYSINCFRHY